MLKQISYFTKKRKDGKGTRSYGIYKCACGNAFEAMTDNVKKGNTTKCKECARKSRSTLNTKHGKTRKSKSQGGKAYYTWQAMKRRCNNPNDSHYKHYGAKGVKVCDEWADSFEKFFADMGEPRSDQSIERIDRNSGYCKENCKWATTKQQANNRSNNKMVTAWGETKTLAEWCDNLSLNYDAVKARLNKLRMPPEEALDCTPVRERAKYSAGGDNYPSLASIAKAEGMSISGVHARMKSENYPNWYKI